METALIPSRNGKLQDEFYDPAEDSFLLLDALESDLEELKRLRPAFCLEIGCGSGIIISSLAKALGSSCFYLATDINIRACNVSKETSLLNSVNLEIVSTSFVSAMLPRLENKIDVLLFNPPYVATMSNEVGKEDISAAWAGGLKGREVMNQLFPQISQLLTPSGLFYLVALEQNDPDDIAECLEEHGLTTAVVSSRRFSAWLYSCFF